MLNNKTFLRIISLVAAVLLWAYVMIEVDPEKSAKTEVTVSFVNEDVLAEEGLAAVENEDDMTVAAVVKGKRSKINSIKKTGMTAYVDVSSCKKGSNREEIVVNIPEGISVENVSEEYLKFRVEELAEETRTLSVKFKEETEGTDISTLYGENKVPYIISKDPEEVTITGAQSAVEQVDAVEGTVSVENLSEKESKWVRMSVSAVDKDGQTVSGVYVSDSESVKVQLMLLTLKDVDVDIDVVNIGDGLQLDEADKVGKITIAGYADTIDDIDKIKGTADMTDVTDTDVNEIKVNLNLPEGIYLYESEDPLTVKVKLKAVQ